MNKEKIMNILGWIGGKLKFLRLTDPDRDDQLDIEEESIQEAGGGSLRQRIAGSKRQALIRRGAVAVLILIIVLGFYLYNRYHTFYDYVVAKSYENEVSSGTQYLSAGKYIYRYNSDGISCVNRKNNLKWSITYNMQAPMADACGDTVVIAEQQGTQIYIVNKDGLVGNFQTLLPIMKVRVSKQGVVAAVLREDDVTWVNLYEADGSSIANDKTTVRESGYPVDIDLSPDGQRLAVSYLGVGGGVVTSDVVYYHFGSAGQNMENHVVSETIYQQITVPELYFLDNSQSVVVRDDGFSVYKGSDEPEEAVSVSFEQEILACFHDEDYIGFLFTSQDEDYAYRLELYNYNGRKKLSRNINTEYEKIRIQNGQIIMYSDRHIEVFTSYGTKRFSSDYEKSIEDIYYFSEFRKYLVITGDSFDKIRIS